MNMRRMVMVMLVLVCLVQGVSATTINISGKGSDPWGYTDHTINTPNLNYHYTAYSETYKQLASIENSGVYLLYGVPNTTARTTYAGSGFLSHAGVIRMSGGLYVRTSMTLTDDSMYEAAGASCDSSGFFSYYQKGYHINTTYDSYEFGIFDGINYSIYFSGTDEWHNFTATASDHAWNPTCTLPSVSGTITALDGEGVYNLNVTIADWGGGSYEESTYTDSNGSYIFYKEDSGSSLFSLMVSGYCNLGEDCALFGFGTPFLLTNGTERIVDYTWHIPSSHRVKLEYENGTGVSSALLHLHDLPLSDGTWRTTAVDGYTTYTSRQTSKIYVDYHGGDGGTAAGATALHSFTITPNGQYRQAQYVLTLPDDFTNNTTIPPVPDVVDEANLTDITQIDADTMFLVYVRDSISSAPLQNALVTAMAQDKNYTGQHIGYTNATGEYAFPRNYSVGKYDVSAGLACYLSSTLSRYGSATFDLVYSCDLPPGTDDNGTGGWQENASNWTYNGTLDTENDMKAKVTSTMYLAVLLLLMVMLGTYFMKK